MGLRPRSSARGSADLDFAVGNKLVGRHRQIGGRGPLADAARGVVLRTVAGAEEAVVIAVMRDGMQPRWVQMPITTSHWSWPSLTRDWSVAGSGRLETGTLRASSICFLVRWLM